MIDEIYIVLLKSIISVSLLFILTKIMGKKADIAINII